MVMIPLKTMYIREDISSSRLLRGTERAFAKEPDRTGMLQIKTPAADVFDLTGHRCCDISQNGSRRGKLDRFGLRLY